MKNLKSKKILFCLALSSQVLVSNAFAQSQKIMRFKQVEAYDCSRDFESLHKKFLEQEGYTYSNLVRNAEPRGTITLINLSYYEKGVQKSITLYPKEQIKFLLKDICEKSFGKSVRAPDLNVPTGGMSLLTCDFEEIAFCKQIQSPQPPKGPRF